MDLRNILGVFSLIFGFWPLMLLAPLNWRKNTLLGIIYLWSFFAILRILFFFFSITPSVLLISEPLNTFIFFGSGGVLFLIYFAYNSYKKQTLWNKSSNLLNLSPSEFENMVVEYLLSINYKAERTGSVGDHGVDVIGKSHNGEKIIVQCKRWRGIVGEQIIREFHGVMQHEKADKGIIITTGKFTNQAREWARGKPIDLIEGEVFQKKVNLARRKAVKTTPNQIIQDSPNNIPICPICGKTMVLRIAKKGDNIGSKFWGCSGFPECRGTLNIAKEQ
jgi:HJR/Mrr/RecB family endonuclease